ncbi:MULTISPECIES: sensor histidine kinase [Burkholderia]|uniref:sensor histidine kinase n=1 Tax=Burkholderia TaxID=32008 RepID=UPI000572347F|nr:MULTISPECIES: ATP-binding protein [Burkholderia]AOJ70127.1 ATPase [Burkholderia savannae]AOJ82100.1 ATPase [Burkholderia savannae]KVG42785.1 ATPase [Burkholderia sp. MSMB0265]KVG78437.1 ATPase [Burkholderia sp. MSMB2040]KVG90890.1 ATPase [Burkholderia sp. MSMB2041]
MSGNTAGRAAAPAPGGAGPGAPTRASLGPAAFSGGGYATIDDPYSPEAVTVKRRLLVLLALAAMLAAACALTWAVTWRRGVADLRDSAAARVDRTTNALKSTLDRYESLPYLLGGHPFVQDVLAAPGNRRRVNRANLYLEDMNRHAHATATYVIAANGLCVAASNWRGPDSFTGIGYQFRPYFIDAVKGGTGRFFGIGTISRDPGYYISQPVRRDGKIIGVAVVKLNLEWFQGADASEPLVVADDHGVIFLSSVPEWKYHTLKPLPGPIATSIHETRQYAQHPVTPLPLRVERVLGPDAQIVRMGAGRRAPRYLATRRLLGEPDWQLVTLAPIEPVDADARNATIVTAFGFVSLSLLAFYWRTRRARVKEMLRSRVLLQSAYAELNRRVEERTADLSQANARLKQEVGERIRAEHELRAAHDELVQASKLAALGQMAAGITHELNQPLAALRSFSDNTRVLLDRGDQAAARENLEAIAALTERMGKITNQLKLFVGRAKPRNEQAHVARALRNVLALLKERLKGVELAITLRDETRDPAEAARFDPSRDEPALVARCEDLRLEQVLINLLGNALDAVAAAAAPRIDVTIDATAATLAIVVRDNGPGIAPESLARLFEPFFTTKEMGRGLGLGLAISSSIARDAGGSLTARNAPAGGAEFVLTLRRARTHHPDTSAAS